MVAAYAEPIGAGEVESDGVACVVHDVVGPHVDGESCDENAGREVDFGHDDVHCRHKHCADRIHRRGVAEVVVGDAFGMELIVRTQIPTKSESLDKALPVRRHSPGRHSL